MTMHAKKEERLQACAFVTSTVQLALMLQPASSATPRATEGVQFGYSMVEVYIG